MADEELQPVYAEGVKPPKDQLYPGTTFWCSASIGLNSSLSSKMVPFNTIQHHHSRLGQLLCSRYLVRDLELAAVLKHS
jgi:hypothetical protein